MSKHFIGKLIKSKEKEQMVKAAREKVLFKYENNEIYWTSVFSSDSVDDKREGNSISKVSKEKK